MRPQRVSVWAAGLLCLLAFPSLCAAAGGRQELELSGGGEQRWLHIQDASADNRVLLETRLDGDHWFLDTFIKSGATSRALYAEDFKHPLGRWYHVTLVYDGALMRHYVDGREELPGPLTIEPLGEGRTSLGVRMNRVHWFKGAVSRVRFTRRALRPEEFMNRA